MIYDLFEWLSSNEEETYTKSIAVSFVQLAEGVISDLLSDDQKPVKKYFDPTSGTAMIDTTTTTILCPVSHEEFITSFQAATARRRSRMTMMNNSSSRSHSLLTIYIEGCEHGTSVQLNIVDLVGSEKIK